MEKHVKGEGGKRERIRGREGEYGSGHLANCTLRTLPSVPPSTPQATAAFWQVLQGCEKITFPVDRRFASGVGLLIQNLNYEILSLGS